jgi:hypothetical protein
MGVGDPFVDLSDGFLQSCASADDAKLKNSTLITLRYDGASCTSFDVVDEGVALCSM